MTRTIFTAALLVWSLVSAGCRGNSSTTTSPTTTTTAATSTELFSGTLAPKGSAFYSFSVTNTGTVSITLASTATARIGPASVSRLTVGLGVPSGFGCAISSSVETTAGLTAQLSAPSTPAGILCVNISDPGVLTTNTLFVIRIVHT